MSKNKNNPLSLQKQTSFKKSGSPKKFVESISRKMCTELIKTYNTSIIDYFEKTLQASLIKEAKRCANDEKNDMTDEYDESEYQESIGRWIDYSVEPV